MAAKPIFCAAWRALLLNGTVDYRVIYVSGRVVKLALVAMAGMWAAFAIFGAFMLYDWWQLGSSGAQEQALASEFPGFSCQDLTVIRRVRPRASGYGWGALLAMKSDCRKDLHNRALKSVRYTMQAGHCFARFSRFNDRELCFEGEEVYFGAYRLP